MTISFLKKAYSPKTLLLFDGFGALVSAFFLGVLLVQFQSYVGMPTDVLYSLASLALLYALFGLSAFLFIKKGWSGYLKIVVIANLIHCAITVGFLITYRQDLLLFGWIYFVLEIVIILLIVSVELRSIEAAKAKV